MKPALLAISIAVSLFAFSMPSRGDLTSLPLAGPIAGDATVAPSGRGIAVSFGATSQWPNVCWKAPAGSAWNWSPYGALVFSLANPTRNDVEFCVRVDDSAAANGIVHCATGKGVIKAGKAQRFYFALSAHLSAQETGMRWAPPSNAPAEGVNLHGAGTIDPSHIVAFQIFRARPTVPASLVVESLSLTTESLTPSIVGLVDRYGQYTRADWLLPYRAA